MSRSEAAVKGLAQSQAAKRAKPLDGGRSGGYFGKQPAFEEAFDRVATAERSTSEFDY